MKDAFGVEISKGRSSAFNLAMRHAKGSRLSFKSKMRLAEGAREKANVIRRMASDGLENLRTDSRYLAGNYYTMTRSKAGPRGDADGATHTMESNGGLIFKPRRVDFRNTGKAVLPAEHEKIYDSGIKLTTGAKVVGGSAVAAGAGGGAYAYNKKKKNVSKSAFGVDHEVYKSIKPINITAMVKHGMRTGDDEMVARAMAAMNGRAGYTNRGLYWRKQTTKPAASKKKNKGLPYVRGYN